MFSEPRMSVHTPRDKSTTYTIAQSKTMNYKGIITPMLTPFDRKGEIDYDATRSLIEFLKKSGVNGLFPLGSTGLFPFLRFEERKRFLQFVIENSMGLPVFSGVGSSSTQEAVEQARFASEIGSAVNVLMPPYYIIPGQEEIRNHFETVLKAVDHPLFIYNIPQLAGSRIEPETVLYLKENYSSVVGMKESSADMRYFSQIMALHDKNFSVFQGQDDLLLPSMAIGADGGVCGLSNFSQHVVEEYKLINDGNYEKARKVQLDHVNPLLRYLNGVRFPSGYYAAFYEKFKFDGGYRAPMLKPDNVYV